MDTIKKHRKKIRCLFAILVLATVLFGCAEKAPFSGNAGEKGSSAVYSFSKEVKDTELLNTILQNSNLSNEKKNGLVNNLLNFLSDTYAENSAFTITSLDELKLLNELLINFGQKKIIDECILVSGDGVKRPGDDSYYEKLFESGYIIVTEYWYPAYNVERNYKSEKSSGLIKISATVTEFEEVATGMTAFFDFVPLEGSPEGETIELSYTTEWWKKPEKNS